MPSEQKKLSNLDAPASHRAYAMWRIKGEPMRWVEIGAAFMHKDGKGFDVLLNSLPIPIEEFDGHVFVRAEGATLPDLNEG